MQLTRELMQQVLDVAIGAGKEILAIYRDESLWQLQHKADDSPLTAADMAWGTIVSGIAAVGATWIVTKFG